MYAFEDGRALPVGTPRTGPGAWSEGDASAVRSVVLDLVGLPLLPVGWRRDDDVLGEHLVTLDATGAAVVVVVTERLDAQALVAALARSAVVRRAAWREVASWYPAGADRLHRDWAAFRETLPPRARRAPGLVLVAGQVPAKVRAALEVLDPGAVLAHEVIPQARGGERVYEVTELSVGVRPRDGVVDDADASDGRDVELLGGVVAAPAGRAAARDASRVAPAAGLTPPSASRPPVIAPSAAPPAAPPVIERQPVAPPQVSRPAPVAPAVATPPRPAVTAPRSAPAPAPAAASVRPTPSAPLPRRRERVRRAAPDGREALAAVVALVGEVELVLDGSAGSVRSVLTSDATITARGRQFTDPAEAATALTGRAVADGWMAWRFGENGPFLGEALEESLRQDVPARPARRPAVER